MVARMHAPLFVHGHEGLLQLGIPKVVLFSLKSILGSLKDMLVRPRLILPPVADHSAVQICQIAWGACRKHSECSLCMVPHLILSTSSLSLVCGVALSTCTYASAGPKLAMSPPLADSHSETCKECTARNHSCNSQQVSFHGLSSLRMSSHAIISK